MFSASKTAGPSGYNINNSLRFRSSASAYLNRTPASNGDRQKWTFSGWVKRGASGVRQGIFVASPSGTVYWALEFETGNNLNIYDSNAGGSTALTTTALYRDFGAWYHVVVAVDTTQATASNRCKIYVNGSQVTSFVTANYPTQNSNTQINTGSLAHYIGNYNPSVANLPLDGYLAEVNFIDGQALTPSSFGSTNATTGVWQPAKYTGTYGTNGFYLPFSDIATTSGSNAGLGKDFSGNSNYWTTNNISVTSGTTYDAMTDSPTLTSATVANYATLNPIQTATANITWANANLQASLGATGVWRTAISTMAVDSGKWYAEFTLTTSGGAAQSALGILPNTDNYSGSYLPGSTSGSYGYVNDGTKYNNGTQTGYGNTYTTGDIIGIAYDGTNNKIWFSKNGVWQASGDPVAGTNSAFTTNSGVAYYFAVAGASLTQSVWNCNFGQRPFSYTPPTGFNRLNTFNLPTSTIVKGNSYMDATLFTGNVSGATVTNAGGFRPDFVWRKTRDVSQNNGLYDSVRGGDKELVSNSTAAEGTNAGLITSFNSNGFTYGNAFASANTYVGWQWQAGQGSTSSNTSGSITSTVSVNTTAGFSVVTYTGTGTTATIGHGLGVAPAMIITKNRTTAGTSWIVYHSALGATKGIYLDLTNAAATSSGFWNNTAPTSSVFTVFGGNDSNTNANAVVAYCWAEIAGFSRFGSYTGNGSADGPFVFTGFRPKWIMLKRTDAANIWLIGDSRRDGYNSANPSANKQLQAQATNTESNFDIDYLSNGFKLRNTDSYLNASGGTYIYAAFAENPFKNALAR